MFQHSTMDKWAKYIAVFVVVGVFICAVLIKSPTYKFKELILEDVDRFLKQFEESYKHFEHTIQGNVERINRTEDTYFPRWTKYNEFGDNLHRHLESIVTLEGNGVTSNTQYLDECVNGAVTSLRYKYEIHHYRPFVSGNSWLNMISKQKIARIGILVWI